MKKRGGVGSIALQRSSNVALYRQIYLRVRGAVLTGGFVAGMRLPSARSLSDQLGVARGTVEMAYGLLASEGYIVSRGAAGTTIAASLRNPSKPSPSKIVRASPNVSRSISHSSPSKLLFEIGKPALDVFPRKLWSRIASRAARGLSAENLALPQPSGVGRLRRAISAYLQVARGIDCTAEQIFITAGYQGALGLVAHLLMKSGDKVWVEDPGYLIARRALQDLRMKLIPVPVDQDGLKVGVGKKRAHNASFALVTPSHHFPTGVTMTVSRRLELLVWATRADAWVIEDDYDSEFHYRGRPLASLKSLDTAGRVLFVGTFSKVLFPALRMGYLVVPVELASRFADGCTTLHPATGALEQLALAEFLERGHFTRHISRMRSLYSERRASLVASVQRHCGELFRFELQAGGMHLIAYLGDGIDAEAFFQEGAALGLALTPLSLTEVEITGKKGVLLGFANIPMEEADEAARRLRRALLMTVKQKAIKRPGSAATSVRRASQI